jgi:Domain of unknown function (DUF4190)/Septum formation
VGLRYNPPPGWPPAPPGFTPPPGWQPDPSWPPPPPGWQLWVNDDQLPSGSLPSQPPWEAQAPPSGAMTIPPLPPYGARNTGPGAGAAAYGGGGYGNPGSPYGSGASYADTGTTNYADTSTSKYVCARRSDAPGSYGAATTPGAYDAAPGQYAGTSGQYGQPGPYPEADRYPPGQYPPGQYPPGPYGPDQYGPGPYAPGMPPQSGKMSGWAIASFVLGLIGGFLLSVIFGFIALSRIKRLGQRGRGLAIAGIVLSVLWLIGFIAIGMVGSHGQTSSGSSSSSSSSGNITHSGKLSVFSLAVGDCFNNPAGASTVTTVTAIPCNQAHNAQIYAKFNLTGSDHTYPGTSKVTKLAAAGCNARTGSINKSAAPSSMTIRLLFPEMAAWLNGRRTVACMIVNPTADITSSLVNS